MDANELFYKSMAIADTLNGGKTQVLINNEYEPEVEYVNQIMSTFQDMTINKIIKLKHDFSLIGTNLWMKLAEIDDKIAYNIAGVISRNIKFGNNWVYISNPVVSTLCNNKNINGSRFVEAIDKLCNAQIIFRTDRRNIFGVNVNCIFKGNLIDYRNKLIKYKLNKGMKDEKGRSITDKFAVFETSKATEGRLVYNKAYYAKELKEINGIIRLKEEYDDNKLHELKLHDAMVEEVEDLNEIKRVTKGKTQRVTTYNGKKIVINI